MRAPAVMWIVMAMVLCNMMALRGSKVLVTLFSIELGASKFIIGILVALYSLFPMFLGLYAGKLADRLGVRWPVVLGSSGVALGLIVPFLFPQLPALYVQAAAVGAAHVFYNVAIQNLIGGLGTAEDRTRNFTNFALAMSVGGFLGPLVTGFAIDHIGHARSYLVIAVFPLITAVIMLTVRALREAQGDKHKRSKKSAGADGETKNSKPFALLSNRPLRRTLITSAVILTAIDLFYFFMPIYGHSIGLSASMIGIVLSMFAAASFVVRVGMPAIVKRLGEEEVLRLAIFSAAVTYTMMPFVSNSALLMAVAFALGLGTGCGQPLSLTLIYSRAPEGRSGEALGLRMTINNFTHMITPLVFGAVGSAFGVAPVFLLNSAMLVFGGILISRK
ncbi:MAG: MFS transporter [Burkholderiales bacterium]